MDLKKNIFISVPIDYLKRERELIEKYRFNLELKIFSNHLDLYSLKNYLEFKKILEDLNIRCTFHAPFINMDPGSFDRKIRKVVEDRYLKVLDLACLFKPENIVYHTGYFEVIHSWFYYRWIDESMRTWNRVLNFAKKIKQKFSLENVFDPDTSNIEIFLERINSDLCGLCFDVGHYNVYSKDSIDKWFEKFRDKIFEVHIHDNDGTFDWHKAVGEGKIDFYNLFKLILKFCPDAILTLEAHTKERMLSSYNNTLRIIEEVHESSNSES